MKTFSKRQLFVAALFIFPIFSFSQVDVLTQHNDLARTGWNNKETVLNHSNITPTTFGLLFTAPVDDQIYTQPLVAANVNISGVGSKNVVYVCTVNNSVYAFDADNGTLYWHQNFTPANNRPAMSSDMHPSLCGGNYWDFQNYIGIVGTPVIAKAANTMYFVTKEVDTLNDSVDNHPYQLGVQGFEYTYTSAGFHQYLHAIDLSTGNEKTGSPVEIKASAPGTGDGNINGTIYFDPRRQLQRAGLVLSRGIVYITYAGHCDWNPGHGWVIGYDSATLQQKIVYISTPNDGRGGIWMSGAAPAVDSAGNIYVSTGNGYDGNSSYTNLPFSDLPNDTANRGESVIKLSPNAPDRTATSLKVSSFFTPYNYAYLNEGDLDFPTQALLIPNTNMLMTGCKDNNLYLLNKNSLGGYNSSVDSAIQITSVGANADMHCSFAYFGGSNAQYVYQLSENTLLQSYQVLANSLGNVVQGNSSGPTGDSGGYMSVSSNGSDTSTGVLWVLQAINGCDGSGFGCQGILRAINASNINTELWNSTLHASDNPGHFGKMTCPTVANGKAYVNTASDQLAVYGLLNTPRCAPNVAVNKTATASSSLSSAYGPNYAFDGNTTTSWSSSGNGTQWIYVDLGQLYNICSVNITWLSLAVNFNIQVATDTSSWTTIDSVTSNTSYFTQINGNYEARYVRMYATLTTGDSYNISEMDVLGTALASCNAPQGLTVGNITQNTATIYWGPVVGANNYFVEYKTPIVSSWDTASTTADSLNISALSCGTSYNYQVETNCGSGTSTYSSGSFTTGACTVTCGALPTRHYSADIGNVGLVGSSCLNNGIYTIQGSGAGIGGNSDAFQFAFIDLSGDNTLSTEVLTQDNSSSNNMAGLMMRDSVSSTSMFAYIAVTSGNGIEFVYRTSPGAAATVINGPSIKAPCWLELVRTGTTYSAYYSLTGNANNWVQVGNSINLSFSGISAYMGMAVTSSDNSLLSIATFSNYNENSSSGSVGLINFTAKNESNQNVLLNWTTSDEFSNSYFDVERGNDTTNLQTIAVVQANDSNDVDVNYSYQDDKPLSGLNYYRIKQVNQSGNITYSSIDTVTFYNTGPPIVSPNPATSFFTVNAGSDPITDIILFDAAGKTVVHIINTNSSSFFTIPIADLSAGIYIVEIKTAQQVYKQKLLKTNGG